MKLQDEVVASNPSVNLQISLGFVVFLLKYEEQTRLWLGCGSAGACGMRGAIVALSRLLLINLQNLELFNTAKATCEQVAGRI